MKLKENKLLNEYTKFYITEAYKSCRTNIKAKLSDNKCKKIMITSPLPNEGKSITCANLAISFAEIGGKVLLLECNLRKPSQEKLFESKVQNGLSDFLEEKCTALEIITSTSYANLDLIPAGHIPANPSELLDSNKISILFDELEALYDYIIVDTPPVNIVTDASILAAYKEMEIIFVVRRNYTKHKDIKEAIRRLEFVNGKVKGFILNDLAIKGKKKKLRYTEK